MFQLNDEVLNQVYSKDILFVKVTLKNTSENSLKKILYFDHLLTGNVDLMDGEDFIKGGSSIPISKRQLNSVYTAFEVNFSGHEQKEVIIRKYGHHVLNSKIFISNEFDFYKVNTQKLNVFRAYAGAMFALFVYNLFIAIFTKNNVYFTYCGYLATLFLTVLGSQGIVDVLDIFENTTLSHYLIVFSSFSLIFAWHFTSRFLSTDEHIPGFKYVVWGGTFLASIPILYALTPWFNSGAWLFGNYIDILIPLGILSFIIAGVIVSLKKNVLGYIYLISWSFLFLGAFLYLGSVHGFLGRGYIYNNGLLFGNVFEMLILSLGLSYQIITLGKEKDEALEKLKTKEKLQRLVRVLSHDIANSLQVSILYLKRASRLSKGEVAISLTEALKATGNITDILNHVRTEQRLEEVRETIECRPINLKECLGKALFLFEDKIKQKDIQLLDNTCADSIVYAEGTTLVNNILGNILSNVIKFSPKYGKVTLSCYDNGKETTLEIRDEGAGFSEDVLKQFNEKSHINSYLGTAGEGGTGFGMRIIETYMSLYEGAKIEIFNDNGAVYKLSFKRS